MKYRLHIFSVYDDGSRDPLYYELSDDIEQLKAIAREYTKDDEFNKKIIEKHYSSEIVVTLEEMNSDGNWTLLLEYIDFL